ncbi:MAG: DUF4838 domain-containing protein [Planctomycetota bacterium]|jgi:hypothetical protein
MCSLRRTTQTAIGICLALLLTVVGSAFWRRSADRVHVVAADGRAKTRIIVAENASVSTRYAAEELQRFLGEITGAEIPIANDREPMKQPEIILGDNAHLRGLPIRIDLTGLGKEGYVLRSVDHHLVIAGGEPRGTLYGVYGLLEDHLGCRWFTTEVSRIPKRSSLTIGPLDEHKMPVLEYREPFVLDCRDGDWAARNRTNGHAALLEARHGGKVVYCGFVHTFNGLVPPDKYFDEHPEYFSMIDGKRIREGTQLCCTNEDVVVIVTEEIRRRMREHPEATVFSVSQNDWQNYCRCPKCAALAEKEGSDMAPVLFLVNRVADAVGDEFPDKAISTLAYQGTRKPCRTMRPRPNVIIRLCSIECCFSHPFESCDSFQNKAFVKDTEGWSKMCDRLWVWNYNTSFRHYYTPYPNLRVRAPNIRFFVRNNVRGIFEQDVYTTTHGEFSELSGYLGAKLLWDPDYDPELAINEFLEGVYGAAAGPIRRYIDLLHDRVRDENIHMDIWINPEHPVLNDEVLRQADRLWDAAEAAVADQPDVLDRVRIARLPIHFAMLERIRGKGLQMYEVDQRHLIVKPKPELAKHSNSFFSIVEREGLTAIGEGSPMQAYKATAIAKGADGHPLTLRGAEPIEGLTPGLRYSYYEGDWSKLPNFDSLSPQAEGMADVISADVARRDDFIGLVFTGYFHGPKDGVYSFLTHSEDGTKLYIGDQLLVDNDGSHRAQSRIGFVALEAGYHRLRVEYFETNDNNILIVRTSGPGIKEEVLDADRLWHLP